jgi:hypothetical protein
MSFLISVDGQSAPTFKHPTLEAALLEAKRLSPKLTMGAKIRIVEEAIILAMDNNRRMFIHPDSPDGCRDRKISIETALKVFG